MKRIIALIILSIGTAHAVSVSSSVSTSTNGASANASASNKLEVVCITPTGALTVQDACQSPNVTANLSMLKGNTGAQGIQGVPGVQGPAGTPALPITPEPCTMTDFVGGWQFITNGALRSATIANPPSLTDVDQLDQVRINVDITGNITPFRSGATWETGSVTMSPGNYLACQYLVSIVDSNLDRFYYFYVTLSADRNTLIGWSTNQNGLMNGIVNGIKITHN